MKYYYEFFHQLLKLSRTVVSNFNKESIIHNLHHSQWRIMRFLKEVGPSTLVEIANYLSVEKSSVTRGVYRLKKCEFIEEVSGKDKRERRIKLSDLGEEAYVLGYEIAVEFEENAMKGISKEELETTFKVLLKIKNNINNEPGGKNE
ncbi:MarR family transcriptional regulator [Clostridium estertheticum]|uniref:MarR family transcriptional regulator n=1 Tax=Clostridium estertheticum TaxID=238834 RepID=A0AA47I781_9CLOT|nr:MarR family transcriptional regulator [Clostridium estertheticum]MBU3155841.1 MarR family transcriptional regulator [Clostridium estertheticum]MBU3199196.1 MarR family transcriptional regulator [Clostridium estertheticum]WAG62347.1 MarR family transcriptional regulator [Clostridium estertheticum]WAG63546.1 MarR family transcriptional regulator [Clostridium estertheticum]